MSSHGIKDRVAIVGMGCTSFGERFDTGLDDLLVDATDQAFTAAGTDKDAVDAYWFGTAQSGMSGITLARPLQLVDKPVTRVENFCATGTEAFRGAAYAVASGACDIALALGVEKLKDTGYGGLPATGSTAGSLVWQVSPNSTAPGCFAQLASGYAAKHGTQMGDVKRAIAQVSSKSHDNAFTYSGRSV